jgi:chaperone BCS1
MYELLEQLRTIVGDAMRNNQFLSGGAALMVFGAAAAYLRGVPAQIWTWLYRRLFMDFEIQMKDTAFWWFNEWLSKHPYAAKRSRWMSVRTVKKDDDATAYDIGDEGRRIILSPAPGTHWMFWRGRFMSVVRNRKEPEGKSNNGMISMTEHETYTVSLLTRKRELIVELLEEARNCANPPEDRRIKIYTAGWSDWNLSAKRTPRDPATVVLESDLFDTLKNDMSEFLDSEKWYNDCGIPWRRGYLLYGPPGNGKSSTVVALASALGLDVCILNLSSGDMNDTKLVNLFMDVPPKSIVIIEDIDCVFDEQRNAQKDKDNKLTFSGLLNAIDGVTTADGRILVMTTNYRDRLDSALIRPGRCDLQVKVDNATVAQAERMFCRFFPDNSLSTLAKAYAQAVGNKEVSMAAIQGHLLKHRKLSPHLCMNTIEELLNESKAANEAQERATREFRIQAEKRSSQNAKSEDLDPDDSE